MHSILHAIWLTLLLSFSAQAQTYSYYGVSPKVIIDVRTPQEFASGHVDGAINIPYDQITSQSALLMHVKQADPVLVYCRSGRRSAIARQELGKLGYQNVLDGGGLDALTTRLKTCKSASC